MPRLTRAYGLGSPFSDVFPVPIISTRNPTANDIRFELGQVWVNTNNATSYMLNQISGGTATWTQLTAGTSDVDTINSLAPVAGNIVIDGGTNITDSNAGNTVTLNLDDAISLATSVTSPLYTAAAGTDVQITAPANQDINLRMGDAAGGQAVVFQDSTGATVFSVDSSGAIPALGATTFNGLLTANASATINTAGTALNLGTDNAAGAINIGHGTTIRAINIGTVGGVAHTITLGSGSAGNIAINAGAGTLLLDSNGVLELNSAAGAISIGNDADAQNINVGTGAAARTITVGNTTGASSVVVDVGTGNADFGVSATAHTTRVGSTTGASATTVQAGSGALNIDGNGGAVNIDAAGQLQINSSGSTIDVGNDAVAQNINVGTGAAARTITVGNNSGATSVVLDVGTGNLDLGVTATAHTTRVGSTTGASATTIQAGSGALTINGSGGAVDIDASGQLQINSSGSTIDIGNDAVAQNINIGTGAAARTVTVGNNSGATSVVVDVGTGNADFGVTATAHTTRVGSTTGASATTIQAGSGALTINGSGGAVDIDASGQLQINSSGSTIDIGNDAVAQNINIGTGAAARTITVGNNSGASSVVVDVGTGNADFGVTATAHTTRVGSTTGASATTIQAGSGALNIDGNAGAVNIDASGQLQINSSGSTIDIGNDAVAQNINVGTGAAARTITVGNTTGATSLVLEAGTGEITVTGTVKEIDGEFLESSGDEITSVSQSPVLTTAANTGGAPTGTGGDVNLMYMQQGVLLESFIIGTQTIIAPRMDANGLLISLDLTASDGVEYNWGAARTNSRHAFTIGTSAAFFFEVGLYINDMDGAAPYVIGFRKSEANNATFADYTDYAAIGMNAASSTTNVVLMTELNSGGQTVTDTTDAWGGDGSTNTLRVLVDGSGNVTYTINGSAPSSTAAFQFDNTDVVCPFIHLFHSASPTEVNITSLKVGFQA